MAALRLPFVSPLANVVVSLQKEPISSSAAPVAPFKLTRRRIRQNHLRQKLLKKPQPEILSHEPSSEFPTTQFQTPSEIQDLSDQFVEQDACEGTDSQEQQSRDVSDQFVELDAPTETIGVPIGGGGNVTFSTRSVLKVGMYLVAAFLFQTLFAVLIFRPDDYEHEDRRLNIQNEKEPSMGVDESEMGKKVVEIQSMARAARVKERLELERNRAENDQVIRTGIGKEVDNKLVRLQKSRVKLPSKINNGSKAYESDQEKSNLADSENLFLFEKKSKFKNSSIEPDNKPHGFPGFRDEPNRGHKGKRRDQTKNGKAKSRKQNRELDDNKADDDDLWWLKLPYVMAVFLHGLEEGEGPEGLFSVKAASFSSSHTVAFEDRGDAINFCSILQSNSEDFNADILPLPVKELEVEVKSKKMKVIVVKKGQLKMYAGQSLPEIESALHTLIK